MQEIYGATNDVVFKTLFAKDSNKDLLKSLIESTLKIEVEDLNVKNSEISADNIADKFCRLDIVADTKTALINLEMQVCDSAKTFADRFLFYWSKLYSGDIAKGEEYTELRKTISVAFLDCKMYNHDDVHSRFTPFDEVHKIDMTDKAEWHFFELKKLKFDATQTDIEKLWLRFLAARNEEDLTMLQQTATNDNIQKAITEVYKLNADEQMKWQIRDREIARVNEAVQMTAVRKQAFEEMVLGMLKEGLAMPVITKISKFSPKDILQIATENGIKI
ncbi:MAG: Rpn family recombination-promoting nuclease/putative transposase [Oscillospiraceae bacterium]|jgi:predicted transposase/invertase (TIGR01784 family)|nr:Rpn family recombination-promoting nuclease/putative transposase [Oscillospiraceae bacterium]